MPTNNGNSSAIVWARTGLRFELTSSDSQVRERATTVFRPWPATGKESITCRWRVDRRPEESSNGTAVWEVEDESDLMLRESPEHALLSVEYGSVLKCIRQSGLLSFHAALLSKQGRGIVIIGPCEAGKSTLSTALWQRKWSFMCDDIALIDPHELRAYSSPRRVSLRPESRELFGEALWSRILASPSYDETYKSSVFHPCEVDGASRPDSTKLHAAFFLARNGASIASAAAQRIEPAFALLAMLPYSNYLGQLGAGEAIQRIQPLADQVAAYDLGRGEVRAMVDRVEEIVL